MSFAAENVLRKQMMRRAQRTAAKLTRRYSSPYVVYRAASNRRENGVGSKRPMKENGTKTACGIMYRLYMSARLYRERRNINIAEIGENSYIIFRSRRLNKLVK